MLSTDSMLYIDEINPSVKLFNDAVDNPYMLLAAYTRLYIK